MEIFMKIEFTPSSEDVYLTVDPPLPAKSFIPEWYKEKKYINLNNSEFSPVTGRIMDTSIKMCMPFLDSLTSGYIQKTWTDIYIENKDGTVNYYYASQPEIINLRDKSNISYHSDEFYNLEFIWKMPYIIKTPKGFSSIVTHPLNRADLPFYTLTGIIDSDIYNHAIFGNLPFYVKKGFSGLIPAGTPMYQIIPIKREKWVNEVHEYDEALTKKKMSIQLKKFIGFYKNSMWQKKEYN
jgi:hypothetical protein